MVRLLLSMCCTYYLRQKGIKFITICLFVCQQDYANTVGSVYMKNERMDLAPNKLRLYGFPPGYKKMPKIQTFPFISITWLDRGIFSSCALVAVSENVLVIILLLLGMFFSNMFKTFA